MIWFWIIATALTYIMSLFFYRNSKEALISTIVIVVFALIASQGIDRIRDKTPNTFLSCQVKEKGE